MLAILDGEHMAVAGRRPNSDATALREAAVSFRQAALRHPRVFSLIALRPVSGPVGLAVTDAVAQLLLAAGLKPAAAVEAYKVLDAYIIGFASLEIARLERPAGAIPALDGYPDLAGLLEESAYTDQDHAFDVGLNLLLDGLLS